MNTENEFNADALPGLLREFAPEWGMVLGSGLGAFVEEFMPLAIIPFGEIPGLPISTVPGHAGRLVLLEIAGHRVVVAQGRVHLYEGHTARQVAAGVRLMAAAGVSKLLLTNAAGTLNTNFAPGSWMTLTDHINLTSASPLTGGPNFFDMSEVYSRALRLHFANAAAWEKMPLHEGVYAGLAGPQYETPAEIRMLRTLGADAVGMSTVAEAVQARALGIEVAGFSFLTNWAAGFGQQPLDHADVLAAGKSAAAGFGAIVGRAFDTLPA
jgi:purine-nucleoside phosphorylase